MRNWALLFAAFMLTGVARAADGDADTCRMPGDSDRRIAACTRLTDDKGLPAVNRQEPKPVIRIKRGQDRRLI